MAATQFTIGGNNIQGTIANAYTPGSGQITLAASYGATLAAKLAAAGVAISPTTPLRFTLIPAANFNSNRQLTTDAGMAVYKATGLSGDTLSGMTVTEGYTD